MGIKTTALTPSAVLNGILSAAQSAAVSASSILSTLTSFALNNINTLQNIYNSVQNGFNAFEWEQIQAPEQQNSRYLLTRSQVPHILHKGAFYVYADDLRTISGSSTLDVLKIRNDGGEWKLHVSVCVRMCADTAAVAHGTYYLYEDFEGDGTGVSGKNRWRDASDAHHMILESLPNNNNNGTLIYQEAINDYEKVGHSLEEHNEFILKQDGNYLLKIENHHSQDAHFQIIVNWWEEHN